MRSAQFRSGDRVMVMGNDEGIRPGEVGVILSRWVDTLYAIRLKDGSFHWVDSSDINSLNPSKPTIAEGEVVQIKSNKHNHWFIKIGDLVQVVKVMDAVEYYKIFINDNYFWLANFELAPYFPLPPL